MCMLYLHISRDISLLHAECALRLLPEFVCSVFVVIHCSLLSVLGFIFHYFVPAVVVFGVVDSFFSLLSLRFSQFLLFCSHVCVCVNAFCSARKHYSFFFIFVMDFFSHSRSPWFFDHVSMNLMCVCVDFMSHNILNHFILLLWLLHSIQGAHSSRFSTHAYISPRFLSVYFSLSHISSIPLSLVSAWTHASSSMKSY